MEAGPHWPKQPPPRPHPDPTPIPPRSPAVQYGAYADFAAAKGLIGADTRAAIKAWFPWCKVRHHRRGRWSSAARCALLARHRAHPPTPPRPPHSVQFGIDLCNGPLGFAFVCQLALGFCQATVVGPIMAEGGNFNIYDVRKKCEGPLCYDFQFLDDYMARPDVREGLGVAADAKWSECDPDVNARLLPDFLKR